MSRLNGVGLSAEAVLRAEAVELRTQLKRAAAALQAKHIECGELGALLAVATHKAGGSIELSNDDVKAAHAFCGNCVRIDQTATGWLMTVSEPDDKKADDDADEPPSKIIVP